MEKKKLKYELKLFAYEEGGDKLLRLDAVTIQADPQLLRRMAEFLMSCADEMETFDRWDHVHLKDYLKVSMQKGPDIIVAK